LKRQKKEEMTIKDLASNNSLYFINEQKEDDQPKMDKKSEKFIHIYKNGEAIKMGSFDTKMSLASLRNIMKNNLSEKANFLSEGSEVPINDENTILLEDIIKENKIYIADSNQSKPEKNENIPIILKIDEKNNFIIKANLSDKLDTIREQNFNIITNDYLFTLKGNIISKEQENIFSIKDITDQSKTVLLKNIKPKIKIKIIEDNNSVKSEQNYDPSDKLSKLRKDLSLESNKVFRRGEAEIDIEDEDNLTVADIQIEGKINIMEKPIKYTIFVNNSQILSECYNPNITVSTLRTYLLMHIPKDCSFIHAKKQTPIPQEIEDTISVNKICDEKK